ncbi:MAG TPA: ABC transporter ATP-binding protein [Candidatus Paceibacterota bacterium]|nr:ABC transporter ATP-binding protein [Candidatus Paceibacterota bacterium]
MKKIFSKIRESYELLVLNAWKMDKVMWSDAKVYLVALFFFRIFTSTEPFLASGALALLLNELAVVASGHIVLNSFYLALGLLVASIVIPALMSSLDSFCEVMLYWIAERKINLLIIKKSSEIDISLHEDPKFKDLFNRIAESGAWSSAEFVFRQFLMLDSVGMVIIASAVLFWANWKIFLLVFFATIPELVNGIYYSTRVWGISDTKGEVRRRYWDIRDLFLSQSSLVELNIFQSAGFFYQMMKKMFDDFKVAEKKNEIRNAIFQFFAVGLSQVALAIAIVSYAMQTASGIIGIGTLTFVLYSVQSLKRELSRCFWLFGRQYKDGLFVRDLLTFWSIKTVIKKPEKGIVLDKKVAPEVVFENVSFTYPGTDKLVLKNFSFVIKPGEKIALVGLNGAGKTTFVKLLCRFYDPTEGRILINGHDLREIDLDSWYHMLGAVFQDYSRYHLTVEEAIAVGRTGDKPNIEKVKDAAKASEADIFIEKWDKAYSQTLGRAFTEGVEPSVGQWQKLALARVFYRDPKVMILDEPTSSIDALSEANIFEKIGDVSDNRSVILISHRFSTVRKAHKIVVIKDGEKAEDGTHEELMAKKGVYAELYQLQAKSYE